MGKENKKPVASNPIKKIKHLIEKQQLSIAIQALNHLSSFEGKSPDEKTFVLKNLDNMLELLNQIINSQSSTFDERQAARGIAKTIHYARVQAFINILKKSYDVYLHQRLDVAIISIDLYNEQAERDKKEQLLESAQQAMQNAQALVVDDILQEISTEVLTKIIPEVMKEIHQSEIEETLNTLLENVQKRVSNQYKKAAKKKKDQQKNEKETGLLKQAHDALASHLIKRLGPREGNKFLEQGDAEKDDAKAISFYREASDLFESVLSKDSCSTDAHFGLMKFYRRLGERVARAHRIMTEDLPAGSPSLKRILLVRSDEQNEFYMKANSHCDMGLSYLNGKTLDLDTYGEIAHIKQLVGQYSESADYCKKTFLGLDAQFYRYYLDSANMDFLRKEVSVIYRYFYILNDQDFRSYLKVNYAPSYIANLYLHCGVVYKDVGQYNAAIQQCLLSLMHNQTDEQNQLSYDDLQKIENYLDNTVFKNIFGLTTPEEHKHIKIAYVMWVKYDLYKKNYISAANKILIAGHENLFFGILTGEQVLGMQDAFCTHFKSAVKIKDYSFAIKIIMVLDAQLSLASLVTEEELHGIKHACVEDMRVDLEKKDYKIAAKKFSFLCERIYLYEELPNDFLYSMGQACTISKSFDMAYLCYDQLSKRQHHYTDVQSRISKILTWKAQQEKVEHDTSHSLGRSYGINGSSVLFSSIASISNQAEPGVYASAAI